MLRLKASASVADYFRLFVNRRAYTLQSNRPHPESGRSGYSWRSRSQRGTAESTFAALPCGWVSRSREVGGGKESRSSPSTMP